MANLPATEDVLSQYQTLLIGYKKLTLPTIALLSSTTDSNLTLSSGNPVSITKVLSQETNGTKVALIAFNIHSYSELQDYNLDTFAYVSNDFCEKLMAPEKNQCSQGLYDGKNSFTPQHFYIIDLAYLISSKDNLFFIGGPGPSGGDVARKLLKYKTNEQISCTEEQQPLCIALMPIPGNLIIVWATGKEDFEADKKRIHWIINHYLEKK